ncbi:amiloride-sensitive sodium channel subunit beta [Plakobranchus ocellatus]|uniref:Amiloride-sensitive sodium channel subunit beta n=1 Tax=Plakobranchus ocellatus TaxID=259542 RepID=A0AAV4CX22_9GAST|nr:amiloride-sensitive sodium channel subunit beta [Plakobranchus ocellatus]
MRMFGKQQQREMGHHLQDMLVKCKFGNEICTPGNFRYFYNLQHGNCYTFASSQDSNRSQWVLILYHVDISSVTPNFLKVDKVSKLCSTFRACGAALVLNNHRGLVSRLLHGLVEEFPHQVCHCGRGNPVLPPKDIAQGHGIPSRGADMSQSSVIQQNRQSRLFLFPAYVANSSDRPTASRLFRQKEHVPHSYRKIITALLLCIK